MTTMQRQVLQAACRPDGPDAMRATRISFQTAACAKRLDVVCAVDRNRTACVVADRLDGLLLQRRSALRHDSADSSRRPASVPRQARATPHRVPVGHRLARHARTCRPGWRMRTPSRGCDARCTLQPVFEHPSQPASRRATRTTPIRVAALAERARAA
ncbi:hypothetical protein [Burkholderia metallica]|uniref:hypothetical protein n=1 Tax=Burkholderia metallica TaxID=488729 RepID=UPI0012F4F0D8|nr:hypothetical protein [Burkholderia metallica]